MIQVREHITNHFGKLVRIDYSLIGYEHKNKDSLMYKLEDINRNSLTQEQRNGIMKGRLSDRNIIHPTSTQLLIITRMKLRDETSK